MQLTSHVHLQQLSNIYWNLQETDVIKLIITDYMYFNITNVCKNKKYTNQNLRHKCCFKVYSRKIFQRRVSCKIDTLKRSVGVYAGLSFLNPTINTYILLTALKHFLWYYWGEFVSTSKQFIFSDHFLYSYYRHIWLSCDVVRSQLTIGFSFHGIFPFKILFLNM